MRILFAGTPVFASTALSSLIHSGLDLVAVLTQPDRPAGRGLRTRPSAVKEVALANGVRVLQPKTLRDPVIEAELRALAPDVLIVAAYGLILPQAILDIPRFGGVNIHASLLPRWRGAAPIQRALLAGDERTGITIMQMEAGLDSGPILTQAPLLIKPGDTAGAVLATLAEIGARQVLAFIQKLQTGEEVVPQPQAEDAVTYAPKIAPFEALIDWSHPAVLIDRKIRAFNPNPGATTHYRGTIWKIWRGEIVPTNGPPGQILDFTRDGLVVSCGQDSVRIVEVQIAGAKRLSASAFHAGRAARVGEYLGGRDSSLES